MKISYLSFKELERIRSVADRALRLKALANAVRLNALSMIMEVGSGHIGSSFSSADIVTWLWSEKMRNPNEPEKTPGDIYFSSKGHDAPALYSLLAAFGKLPYEKIHTLRRLGGLPGHPDVNIPYMITNTGSLGMGISKARGMAVANRMVQKEGKIFVLTGDGELQEGQIWESLQPTANGNFYEITVIVDHNKIQSDMRVDATSDLGLLEDKFRAFGWEVARCNGHDFMELEKVFDHFSKIKDRPQILIADTIKGKGVSRMEKIDEGGLYKFHSGAPGVSDYEAGVAELLGTINSALKEAGEYEAAVDVIEISDRVLPVQPQKLIAAYGDELLKIAREKKDLIAMDADLVLDTGLIPFKREIPERYFECGIAEQDMVSFAGGLALRGFLPVVHSFACFLATRPNEQIFNNATEETKIIYVGSLAGILPAAPGHSHQMVRDISSLGAIPGLTMIEPGSESETREAIRWAVEKNTGSSYIRIASIPVEISFGPVSGELVKGRGSYIKKGEDILVISYGPVLLEECYRAALLLEQEGISAAVMNFPWLNSVDGEWLAENLRGYKKILVVDDHFIKNGLGAFLGKAAVGMIDIRMQKFSSVGIDDIPACGQSREVLQFHKLDSTSLVHTIKNL